MQFSFLQFIKEQRTPVPPVVQADLAGKTVIVTGANSGIGFEAAKHFARMNPEKLILACQSRERGEAALKSLSEDTGCRTAELWILNLADFASVKSFADRFDKEGGRLDILVENAAVIPSKTLSLTPDGWESTFQVNNLSNSLLGLRLLPHMIETWKTYNTTPRIVVVSSEVHSWSHLDSEKKVLDAPNPFQVFGRSEEYITPAVLKVRYQDTKLLNVFFARALSDRLSDKRIIVNSVNPGYCLSNIRSSFTGFQAWVDWAMEKALARTSEEGSRQLIWAALGGKDQLDQMRGAYISFARISEASDFVISKEGKAFQDKLWNNLVDELVKVDPKIQEIVDKYITPPVTA
ncbi:hypothetical protein M413DRAFT_442764 [Hebeloma cylindrosporum]|uniref:NAD(P)-binding protein n=1 Tax=Hebeloma cylindrosporum TaxID=76867 RepID=A0A0C3CKZ6_HEBCY|nr:hypothetical protein M413DRAFT_442764 [Hebeloma cylindrosporum h7]